MLSDFLSQARVRVQPETDQRLRRCFVRHSIVWFSGSPGSCSTDTVRFDAARKARTPSFCFEVSVGLNGLTRLAWDGNNAHCQSLGGPLVEILNEEWDLNQLLNFINDSHHLVRFFLSLASLELLYVNFQNCSVSRLLVCLFILGTTWTVRTRGWPFCCIPTKRTFLGQRKPSKPWMLPGTPWYRVASEKTHWGNDWSKSCIPNWICVLNSNHESQRACLN